MGFDARWAEIIEIGGRRSYTQAASEAAPDVGQEPRRKRKAVKPATTDDTALILTAAEARYGTAEREYQFHPTRRWRFDFAWPQYRVALEREGGRWAKVKCQCGRVKTIFVSRHHSRDGMEEDARKYNAAAALGWVVIRATPRMLTDGSAARDLFDVLEARAKDGNET